MPLDRREFLNLAAVGIATGLLASIPLARAAVGPKIKAIAFDAFPIFDPKEAKGAWLKYSVLCSGYKASTTLALRCRIKKWASIPLRSGV